MTDETVSVSAPARLHLGFLDPGGNFGRRFGGIGLAIDAPATSLTIAHDETTRVSGPEAARAERYLATLRTRLRLGGHYHLAIHEAIPAHSGLGSGTQLALAVSSALRTLEGLPLDIETDAELLSRGRRSGLGAAFITRGGLGVDGGKGDETKAPPLIARFDFPEDWRVILVLKNDLSGIHGERELQAFAELPAFPASSAGEISALTLMQVLPGIAERDLAAFGRGIGRIQEIVGRHFAPAQGGVFASSEIASAMDAIARSGGHGIGQSSWGPTGFAFAESEADAVRITGEIASRAERDGLAVRIARGRNEGASLVCEPAGQSRIAAHGWAFGDGANGARRSGSGG